MAREAQRRREVAGVRDLRGQGPPQVPVDHAPTGRDPRARSSWTLAAAPRASTARPAATFPVPPVDPFDRRGHHHLTAIVPPAQRQTPPPDAGPPIDELAYEQVSRALDQQAGVLAELRQRTSTLIAVSALVATFLGGQSLRAAPQDQGPVALLVIALAAFLVGVGACLAVLLPTRTRARRAARAALQAPPHPEHVVALAFTMNVEVMLDRAQERGQAMPDTIRMETARTLQLAWDENSSIIAGKQRAFAWVCAALLVQTATWIAFIALGREVIA
jgi:hypothetical protein